jgi:hypothetical protein
MAHDCRSQRENAGDGEQNYSSPRENSDTGGLTAGYGGLIERENVGPQNVGGAGQYAPI